MTEYNTTRSSEISGRGVRACLTRFNADDFPAYGIADCAEAFQALMELLQQENVRACTNTFNLYARAPPALFQRSTAPLHNCM